MKNYKNRNQQTLPGMESYRNFISAKKLARLKKTWAELFRNYVLFNLPVDKLLKHYSETIGRPSKDLLTVFGAIVLQQMFNLTDEQTIEELAYNQQWHYALDTFDQNEQILSEKTLWKVRQLIIEEELDIEIFALITDVFANEFSVDMRLQRLDSVHIHSNMAHIGRARILARTVRKFLNQLRTDHNQEYESLITSELKSRYIKQSNSSYFGDVKHSNSSHRLQDIAEDIYDLRLHFSNNEKINQLESYQLLERVFSEHCQIENGDVIVIPSKEVVATSLQNPSDPDAGYSGHKGKGYQVQIMETYTASDTDSEQENDKSDGSSNKKKPTLNLITHVSVESACASDSEAIVPALEDVEQRGLLPEKLNADTAYGSDENYMKCANDYDVALYSPVSGSKTNKKIEGFTFDEKTNEIISCPNGKSPERTKENKREGSVTSYWSPSNCSGCKLLDSGACPVKKGRKGYHFQYFKKEGRLHKRRQFEESEEFKEVYRYRAGIEATNSRYVWQLGAKRLKYRGAERVRFAGTMKALGINIFRSAKYLQVMMIFYFFTLIIRVSESIKANISRSEGLLKIAPHFF